MNPNAIGFWIFCTLLGYWFNAIDGAVLGGMISVGISLLVSLIDEVS